MPSAETRIPTDRASRYLTQLCEHLAVIGQHATPGHAPRVQWNDTHGIVDLPDGQLTLTAELAALHIRAEGHSPAALERIKQTLTERIQTIGRRDNLAVTW